MKIVLYRDNHLTQLTGECLGFFFPSAFCTQQVPKQDLENPNKSMVSRSNVQKDILHHKYFYSWAQCSLRMLPYGSSHPRYALALDKLNQTIATWAACRQEWGLDHLWLCSFSTEVPKYWNWGVCTGNVVVQMLQWGSRGQLYQCPLLYILSHGFAVDDTKHVSSTCVMWHVNVGPLEYVWLDRVLLPRDAKTGFRLAKSFQLKGLCQLCKAGISLFQHWEAKEKSYGVCTVYKCSWSAFYFTLWFGYLSWKRCCFGVAYRVPCYLPQWLHDFKYVVHIFCSAIYRSEVFCSCCSVCVSPSWMCVPFCISDLQVRHSRLL